LASSSPNDRVTDRYDGMSPNGLWQLASNAAHSLAWIGLDRVGQGLGLALPESPEAIARPERLNTLLRDHAPPGSAQLPAITQARIPGTDFESSNCHNFLLELEFADPLDAAGQPVPQTAYVKLPGSDLTTRIFANAVGFWSLEHTFCARIAHQVPIRVPRVYAAVQRGARFVLLLENLYESPGTTMFLNRDMAAGTTVERARRCLTTFAELHAAFWGCSLAQREALFPMAFHTFLAPKRREMTRAMNSAAIDRAQRAAPDLVTPERAEISRLAIEKWDALLDVWYREPLTLIHGDSHLGNCFEYPTEDGPRVGMLDFQGLQWCAGMRDVQYFLINSLEPDLLAANEHALIEHYVEELGRFGVTLAPQTARDQYRALSFQTWMVGVVPLGLGALTERPATLDTVLRRGAAALDRLDVGGWLRSL
jgi:hypothetical protein